MSQVETVQLDTSGDLDDDDRTLTADFLLFRFFFLEIRAGSACAGAGETARYCHTIVCWSFFFPVGHVFRLEYPLIVS